MTDHEIIRELITGYIAMDFPKMKDLKAEATTLHPEYADRITNLINRMHTNEYFFLIKRRYKGFNGSLAGTIEHKLNDRYGVADTEY